MRIKDTIFNIANSLTGRKFFLAILGVLAVAKMYEAQIAELQTVLLAALDLTSDIARADALRTVGAAQANAFGYAAGAVAAIIGLGAIAQAISDKGALVQDSGTVEEVVE